MRMIIVLDKICLIGVIAISAYAGYKIGVASKEIENAFNSINRSNEKTDN